MKPLWDLFCSFISLYFPLKCPKCYQWQLWKASSTVMSCKNYVPQTISLLQINLSKDCGCWKLKLESNFPNLNIRCCLSLCRGEIHCKGLNGRVRTGKKNHRESLGFHFLVTLMHLSHTNSQRNPSWIVMIFFSWNLPLTGFPLVSRILDSVS